MDRRAFLIMALAGAANSGSPPPAPPGVAAPAEPAALADGDPAFAAWSRVFVGRAILSGLPVEVVTREMTGLSPDPRVIALDSRQPEFAKPISDYIKGVISDERIATGRRKRAEIAALPRIESDYGVPGEVLISIWAVETAFGAIQGDFDVVRSLATLAAAGRRRDWAEAQLIAAIRIIADGEATRAQLKGSWAGAMGQTQFDPRTYLTTAVDADGDGRRDIWGSSADALASAANLLAKGGWRRGERWAGEVILPAGFDYGLSEGPEAGAAGLDGAGRARAPTAGLGARRRGRAGAAAAARRRAGPGLPGSSQPLRHPQVQQLHGLRPGCRAAGRPHRRRAGR